MFANCEYRGLDPKVACIKLDIYGGMRRLMKYLVDKGHKRFAFISSARFNIEKGFDRDTQNSRYLGFIDSLDLYGLLGEAYRIGSVTDIDEAKNIIDQIIERKDITAIVTGNDAIAFMIIDELQNRGLRVPDDIAVTGFDNVRFSQIFRPNLTTVDLHIDRMSKTVMEIMLKALRDEPYEHVSWECDINLGDSA